MLKILPFYKAVSLNLKLIHVNRYLKSFCSIDQWIFLMSSTFDPAGDTRLNYLSMLRDPSQEISSGEGSFSFHETRHLATCESSRCLLMRFYLFSIFQWVIMYSKQRTIAVSFPRAAPRMSKLKLLMLRFMWSLIQFALVVVRFS